MDEKDKAQTAEERIDAESTPSTDTFDPEMEKAFDAEADIDDADGDEVTPKPTKKDTPPPPPDSEKKNEPPPPPPPPQEKKDDPPPAELSAVQRAEAEGAKLAGEAPPKEATNQHAEEKSVLEELPEGYKDAGEIIQTDTFKAWFDKAPKHIQKLAMEGGVDGACAVIDFYRSHIAQQTAKAAQSTPAAARRIMEGLGDLEMLQADGSKIKVSEYLKDMGDIGEAIAVIASQVGGKQQPSKPGIEPSRIEKLESELAELRWWEGVTTEHSDARKVIKGQGFKDWAKTASPAIQRLIRSGTVEHTVLVLDAFKEAQVAAAKAKTATTGKDRTNALHSDTARGRSTDKSKVPDDFDDGFETGAK